MAKADQVAVGPCQFRVLVCVLNVMHLCCLHCFPVALAQLAAVFVPSQNVFPLSLPAAGCIIKFHNHNKGTRILAGVMLIVVSNLDTTSNKKDAAVRSVASLGSGSRSVPRRSAEALWEKKKMKIMKYAGQAVVLPGDYTS